MSETLYTCDCCVRSGNDEASCHRAKDLCVIGTDVVCDGCRWEEYPYDAFVMPFTPPHEKRIAELKAELFALRVAVQAAFNCGMVPVSSAKDGGAVRHCEQVRVADMLRAAMRKQGGE